MNKVRIDVVKCKGCGLCIDTCPKKILKFSKDINVGGYNPAECSDEEQCISCAMCAIICPDSAIEVYKK